MLLSELSVNNGHDRARVIREIEPGGGEADYVTHAVVSTGRMIDRLYDRGRLTSDQYDAATTLRNDYDRGRPSMGMLAAQDPSSPYVSGGRGDSIGFGDERSFKDYARAMEQVGRDWRGVIRFVVIEDGQPERYGQKTRSSGMTMLITALDRLAGHYGMGEKRR